MGVEEQLQLPEGLEWVAGGDANEEECVATGTDDDGNALYVARGRSGEETGTACLVSGASEVLMGFFGKLLTVEDYDVLHCTSAAVHWVPAHDGELPDGAVPVGTDEKKRIIYVARVRIGDIVLPAKLITKFHGAFCGWGVLEYLRRKYEVLCVCEDEGDAVDVHSPPESNDEIDLSDGHDAGELGDARADDVPATDGLAWCYAADGDTVDNAVTCGEDKEGRMLTVVRGSEEWELAPGCLRIGEACASIPYYKLGSKHEVYEVLVNEGEIALKWVKAKCGEVPDNAVAGGVNRKGEIMYVARANIQGVWTPGKLNVSTKRAYAAQDGCEFTRKKYEVLCVADGEDDTGEEHDAAEEEEEQDDEDNIDNDERCASVPVNDGCEWTTCKDGDVPSGAVVIDGEDDKQMCVARSSEEEELVCGGVCKGESAAVPYYGAAIDCEQYQCLVVNAPDDCPVFWVPIAASDLPDSAMQCGVANSEERIFVCRAKVSDKETYSAGKLSEGSGSGYFACDDEEVAAEEFEILCCGADAEGLDGATPAILC